MAKRKDYEVGYGKPPVATRFKPGQSGNPRGRPKGAKNLTTIVRDALKETVIIAENGERKTYNKLEIAIKQQINKAAAGDHKAMTLLVPLIHAMEAADEAAAEQPSGLDEADRKVLASLTARFRQSAFAVLEKKDEKGEANDKEEGPHGDADPT